MTTLRFQVAPRVGPAMPRGARVAATVAAASLDAAQRVAEGLRRRLALLAGPAAGPANETQTLRELASQYRLCDPRFADELLAVADHHERGTR